MKARSRIKALILSFPLLVACDEIEDAVGGEVSGEVKDNRGQPVVATTVRLYDLLDNTDFVEGGDIASASAYIDKQAVLASDNSVASADTEADGRFLIEGVLPSAFLAVAESAACSAGFAGFDEETGILNFDTLITPDLSDGLSFEIPSFVVACATAPDVGPDGNSAEAPPFETPANPPTCDTTSCEAAGGRCSDDTCVLSCLEDSCTAAGGSCVADACVMTTCDASMCSAAGGMCSMDGSSCMLPACTSDEDCQAGQPGAFCVNPGVVARAACHAPLPEEIVPPAMATGWTGLRITDVNGNVLADASSDNQQIAVPADPLVRIYGEYGGSATTAYIQLQSGSQSCPDQPPVTDYIAVELAGGVLASGAGDYLELALNGGYQKIQLTTSDVLGEGEQSFAIAIGEPCTAPQQPFTAILSWDAGPSQPADLDLNIWNGANELVFVGNKQAAWGQLALEAKGPGPEVFIASDASQGPFTIKVQFFSGKPRDIVGKLRILRTVSGEPHDESFTFTVSHPKDVAEIGVFAAQ